MGFRKKPIAGAHASRVIGDLQVWSADIRRSRLNLPRDVRELRIRGTRPIGRDPEGQERGGGSHAAAAP
jgi:hypothetical protein